MSHEGGNFSRTFVRFPRIRYSQLSDYMPLCVNEMSVMVVTVKINGGAKYLLCGIQKQSRVFESVCMAVRKKN